MTPLLEVRDLSVSVYPDERMNPGAAPVRAVRGISFALNAGEMTALVGESGCGKTLTALAMARLLPRAARTDAPSRVLFEGADLLALDERSLRSLRGRRLSMVFQEPATALHPLMTVGAQVAEVALVHGERSHDKAWTRAVEMLERVGLPNAPHAARLLPSELSGGMRQRVMIAMALLLRPALVIADEPTSALDVTVQAQILELLRELQRETGTAVLLITHDFGVVAETCSRVLVMREGLIVEDTSVDDAFHNPAHLHTQALVRAVPVIGAQP